MPTQNPRLTVTLKPSTYATLKEVSRLTGNSQSAMIGEILEQSEPVFSRLIQVLAAAEQAKAEVRGKVAEDMKRAQGTIEQQLGLALAEFDTYTGNLLQEVEGVRRRTRRASGQAQRRTLDASGPPPTPPSNRGVRSTANPAKQRKAKGEG